MVKVKYDNFTSKKEENLINWGKELIYDSTILPFNKNFIFAHQ